MEFVLLPLLLLVGLMTALDGGDDTGRDDDGGDGDDGSVNDTLAGSDSDRLYGGTGDDDLTLSDQAVGLGGVGQDTIYAQDDALGYGLEGADSLSGSDNATIKGGDGDDWLSAGDEAAADGGNGDDWLTLAGDAHGSGGDGNDTLTASGAAVINGGAGDDALIASVGNTSLVGGAGKDMFAVDWRDADYASTTVTDFVAGRDQLAVLIGNRDLDALRFTVWQPEGTADTIVRIDAGGDPDDTPLASFLLQGVSEFDLNDVVLCGADLTDPLDWTADPAWTETLTGGAGADTLTLNDSQVGLGEGGNDTLIANDEALAHGGAGADSLRGNDSATVQGGEGNDSLTANFAAEAHGEAGDDVMLSFGNPQYSVQPSLYGGDGNDTLSGDGDLYGGAGNDLIEPDADGSLFNGVDSYSGEVYGGDGDDTIRGDDPHGGLWGRPTFYGGAGNDLIVSDEGGGIDGGEGNDIVITRLHDAVESGEIWMVDEEEVSSNYVRTTLGAGADVLALDLLSVSNPSPDWPFDGSHVIADFNPAQDELALILPSADVGAFTASLVPHAPTGFMQLRLENETASMTLLLEGVTSGFPIGEINIYANEAAVIARMPYATL